MQKYSIFNLIKNAFSSHQNWDLAWKDPTPKKEYDVVIIGGGGHGLATAYYLAKEHNITNVAIIEKGWIGGGNVGRNTTIIRSNYMHDDNALFSEFGMDLWRKDESGFKLQCNVFSKRNYSILHTLMHK
jgi:sarcosine oxidase subunit beta